MRIRLLLLFLFLFPALACHAADRVELVEKLGGKIPLETRFVDASGAEVSLAQIIDGPTLIVPVFYNCRNVCNFMLSALSEILPQVKLTPGETYRVITFSFDPQEDTQLAAHSKHNFVMSMQPPFPPEAWRFLTGKQEDILKLTDAAGYYFKKQGDDFLHPVAAFVVSKDGTIARYLIGQRFSPVDLTMALMEASAGKIGTPIRKALEFCFSYDPHGRRYVFNLMRISATVILLTLGGFMLFLILGGRKKKK